MTARDIRNFRKSLARHPGVSMCLAWAVIVAVALSMPDGRAPLGASILVWAGVSALPWLVVLATAWTDRNKFEDYDE